MIPIENLINYKNPVILSPKGYYGGIFSLPINNIVLTEKDVKWNTNKGKRIQKARYRKLVYKPVKNYCKKRKITNKVDILAMLKLSEIGLFSEYALLLDSSLSYSSFTIRNLYKEFIL